MMDTYQTVYTRKTIHNTCYNICIVAIICYYFAEKRQCCQYQSAVQQYSQDCTIFGVILTYIREETLSPCQDNQKLSHSLNYQSAGRFAAVRRISRSFGSYSPCVCRHRYPRPQEGDSARVYSDCSQAQPSGPNQLSLKYLVSAALIGPSQSSLALIG